MRKLKFFLSCVMLFAVGFLAYAQNINVSGKVTDAATGESVPFASIQVKGTMTGTATDADGNYTISVPRNAILVFSSIGYLNQEAAVEGRGVINILLAPDTESLEELVVVAYGTVNKKDFTGSAASLDSKKLEVRPVTNATNALEGLTSGVQFTSASGQPGSSGSIRIRGFGSFSADSAPLYVVDGVPFDGSISNINSDDIESITVLKDAASSALYGARAANGVVLITTKKGRSEKITFNVRVNHGFSVRGIPEYERLDAYQYVPMEWEIMRNGFLTAGTYKTTAEANAAASASIMGTSGLNNNPFNVADAQVVTDGALNSSAKLLYPDDLDWLKAVERLGHRQEYTVSAGGAGQKSDYYFSLGYLNDQGYAIRSYMERFNARMNVNVQPKKWLKAGLNMAGTMANGNSSNTGSSTGYVNQFYFARNIGPIYSIHKHNPDGSYVYDDLGEMVYEWDKRGGGASQGRHIVAETLWNDNLYKRDILNTRAYVDFIFFEGLKLSINAGYDTRNYLNSSFDNPHVGDGSPSGRADNEHYRYDTMNFNQLLTYNRTFGGHTVDLLVGHESYRNMYHYFRGFRQGLVAEGNAELVNFTTTNSLTGYSNIYTTEGYLARANYNFNHRYYLSASFRRDASSRFYKDARWGNFWSVGGSWRIDQEPFMAAVPWVSAAKLRASYGSVGNDGTSSWYQWQSLYSINRNANTPGFLQSATAGNKDIQWEKNMSFDVALEFGLFRDRITGQVEWFHRVSDNLLFSVPLPTSSGLTSQWQNIGTMYNQGIEVQLGADIVRTKDFTWNVGVNFSHLKNEITKLPQEEIIDGTKKYMVGHSMFDFWMYEWAGVDPETGDSMFYVGGYDDNGNYTGKDRTTTNDYTQADKYYVGCSLPKFYGSLTNTFRAGNFTLSALLTFGVGGLKYDTTYGTMMSYSNYGSSLHVDMLNRWQKPGDVTTVPRADMQRNTYQNQGSSRWLTSASYLNIRNVSLSYSFPRRWAEAIDLSGIQLFGSVENLHLFCARKGMDPQYNFSGTSYNSYSPARTMSVGVNFQF
ncbi:MAG: TonB-dependent receptor [Bacteroidales bacterium]|nr:TonB-dependent receptor [Bacteroidales bacterium]